MGERSKIDLLPEAVRQQLEQRLIGQAFGGYTELATWLAEQGFEISRASVYRWGSRFEDRLKAIHIIGQQAKAMQDANPDESGAIPEALTRMAQEKMFDLLMDLEIDPEKVDPTKLFRAVADMQRASVSARKYQQEVKARALAAADAVAKTLKAAGAKGISATTSETIRKEILGIA